MNKLLFKFYNKPNIEEFSPRKYNFNLYVYLRRDYLASVYLFKFFRLFTMTYGDFYRFYYNYCKSFNFVFISEYDLKYLESKVCNRRIDIWV